ncbi:hypothetical protein BJV77DRAFT_240177 [Russula vinacea]|nr:hypothetical protein BJV77DRAFT_240177 [Russula vinacea]
MARSLSGRYIWLTVFPSPFHPKMHHDFHSLEAEDLHTVNNAFLIGLFHGDTWVQTTRQWWDRKGDHGGGGDLEVLTGPWVYSKGPPSSYKNPPTFDLSHKPFPVEPSPLPSV